ncbi:MAG: hypothetical protein BWX47_02083 [candidate division Hyd24-12 bacterium ADurb.Bin004]|nr:MAG: hypothetical protein BWX47_02083 [candidate division Hyd24-12 bacterium ADurb.Bin004]
MPAVPGEGLLLGELVVRAEEAGYEGPLGHESVPDVQHQEVHPRIAVDLVGNGPEDGRVLLDDAHRGVGWSGVLERRGQVVHVLLEEVSAPGVVLHEDVRMLADVPAGRLDEVEGEAVSSAGKVLSPEHHCISDLRPGGGKRQGARRSEGRIVPLRDVHHHGVQEGPVHPEPLRGSRGKECQQRVCERHQNLAPTVSRTDEKSEGSGLSRELYSTGSLSPISAASMALTIRLTTAKAPA